MSAFNNATILKEFEKSGEQFADLFVRHGATFTPLIQSGTLPRADTERFVAEVNDVIAVAHHTKGTWKFKSYVMVV